MRKFKDNNDANEILRVHDWLIGELNIDNISNFNIHWNEKNRILNVLTVPKQVVRNIEVYFTIHPDGTTTHN